MIGTVLSNVPASTANVLSYSMLLVVAIFLTSGPLITYYYWRKNKRMREASSGGAMGTPEQSA
jgi:uncharacterized membrane protein